MFPPDLEPISNKPLYVYRVLGKWFSFFIIGFSSIFLGILIFPFMRLIIHPKKRFKKYGRRFISGALRLFVTIMRVIQIVDIVPDDRNKYRNLTSKVIVANHPSLLDVVMLISLIPNADCIVNSYLKKNILTGVVLQLYILNSGNLDDILNLCNESLNEGNCLIIFPEGTRTPRSGKNILKKGAARVALFSNCGIIPIHIGGSDKFGLGKKDPWTGFNTTEKYIYTITMKDEINPEKYKNEKVPAAAKLITKEIEDSIFPNTENHS